MDKTFRPQTPVEALQGIRDSLQYLRSQAEGASLDVTADAIKKVIEQVEADIKQKAP